MTSIMHVPLVAGGLDCPSAGRLRAAMVPALKATDGPRCRSAGDRGFLHGLATTDIALLDVVLGFFLPVLGFPHSRLILFR
jgi:hypothetical protein